MQTVISIDKLAELRIRARATDHVVLVMNTPNKNGRIYPTDVVTTALSKVTFPILGCWMGDVSNGSIPLHQVSHQVLDMWIDGDNVMAKTATLDTLQGRLIDQLGADFRTAGICMLSGSPTTSGSSVFTVSDLTLISVCAVTKGQGS